MNIYFSHKFTNLQKKDIQLEFSKKIRDTSDGKELEVIDNRITEVR